jgi:hypothetical protein
VIITHPSSTAAAIKGGGGGGGGGGVGAAWAMPPAGGRPKAAASDGGSNDDGGSHLLPALDRLTLIRCGVKYRLSPLALESIFAAKQRPKVERYDHHYFIQLTLLSVSAAPGTGYLQARASTLSLFLTSPEYDTLISVQPDASDIGFADIIAQAT